MRFEENGFLSDDIQEVISRIKANNLDVYRLAIDFNFSAMKIIKNDWQGIEKHHLIGTLLFFRGLSRIQAAIICAERGLISEAGLIVRGCFETCFYLGAITKTPAFVEKLEGDYYSRVRKERAALVRNQQNIAGLSEEIVVKLRQSIDEIDLILASEDIAKREVKVLEAAKACDLESIYNAYYRTLSSSCAHPSLISLERYAREHAGGLILSWGPDIAGAEETLKLVCTAALYLLLFMRDLHGIDSITNELDTLFERYRAIVADGRP